MANLQHESTQLRLVPCGSSSQLRHLSRYMVRHLGMLNAACGDLPLSPVQAHALLEIGNQPQTIKDLASKLSIDKSNASRAIKHLVDKNLAQSQIHPRDNRCLVVQLTPAGKKLLFKLDTQQNQLFQEILAQLTPAQTQQIEQALMLYNQAICHAKQQSDCLIRQATAQDDAAIAHVIRNVSAEYGLTADKGYSVADPTLDCLSEIYSQTGANYWVVEQNGRVVGGVGIAPLANNASICELQKMYFMPEIRGKGLAKRMALMALDFARETGYQSCYLETTASLKEAVKLYEKLGFMHLSAPLGNTGHDACEMPMLLPLQSE
ncbi:bifunctional helix-turn-helix transcriptional regulator/GNAT family N-acetyltransferase [Shewanella sp. JNE10-2]|jgi:putative acetyltransferase|uniref:bifunctional helix-turn-helix transcriptional regulator/GNAT family N-acetyltransferase n=1 Tax=unclassified Shewanella TaxID=196818 RepID=UPI002004E02E|nr:MULTISPECIES: bifunctional helix-turn-helix transcriptional regulator/GNAT family N-acetyltransferase [unclassified Shewanella]MCK7630372.1 bifunctional helix-turn-helix transcriptional regulator/GNAT family N-acetyltransferase [Shewanella sp. JNE9-1]MCK7633549.1 bifunctional helix-turn-helix transcriptional regulator/GNAT family N-acetyltransferase [Shewanella sp. JNE17]MCK7645539.1 bifunctional helix-turn-helix transcriptional regulator/GNAT family N-acetyltransferase [Shewanella sp. JNE3-1